jgi:adenylylsulfate kinase-like enzyme
MVNGHGRIASVSRVSPYSDIRSLNHQAPNAVEKFIGAELSHCDATCLQFLIKRSKAS